MSWVIYLFGSGAAFYLGIVLLFLSLLLFGMGHRLRAVFATVLAIVGCLFIALSATPFPIWFYAVLGAITVSWLVLERFGAGKLLAYRKFVRLTAAATWALAVVLETPYSRTPAVTASGRPRFFIIGDSVSAGMSETEKGTWPRVLADTHGVDITDLSRMGATAASALKQSARLPDEGGIVLLEIGGNDLLGSTPAAKFADDLERLLGTVCRPGREVLMFELPLPPFRNEYGAIQRGLAATYGVGLIPKRVFIGVLSADGATLDSVHLSKAGHRRMADTVWELIEPAYRNE